MKKLLITIVCSLMPLFPTLAAQPKLTFYAPFDGSLDAKIAGGNSQAKYGKAALPEFAAGLSGQGLLTGGNNQNATFEAAGNISPDQWTITFWMKGTPGASWNAGNTLQSFWELNGSDAFMWFYKYTDHSQPRLLSKKGNEDYVYLFAPQAAEEEWHYWAVTWRKRAGAYLYMDGGLVGRSSCEPPSQIKTIAIGQRENPSVQNKVIDEFKIYDAALDAGIIARKYWEEGGFATKPSLTVPPTRKKITVDGKIELAEWKSASGFGALVNGQSWTMTEPSTWGKVTHDNQNLYLALHSDNGGPANKDDYFLVHLAPNPTDGKSYGLSVNRAGQVRGRMTDASKEEVSWQPATRVKSISGKDGWSIEAAIPLKALGVAIAEGDSWRVNFGRTHQLPSRQFAIWAMSQQAGGGAAAKPSAWGTLTFSNKANAAAGLQGLSIGPDRGISARVNLANLQAIVTAVDVTLSVSNKVLRQQKVTLKPREQRSVVLSGLPESTSGVTIEVTVQSDGKTLLQQTVPLVTDHLSGQVALWKYPSSDQLRLGWELPGVAEPAKLQLFAELRDKNGAIVQKIALKKLTDFKSSALMNTKALAPGKYSLQARIEDGGQILLQQAFPFEKQPLPAWLGNTLGLSDTPPPPWTDVKVDRVKDNVSIWGRTYDYAGHLLPAQIVNQGKAMLSAPMHFTVQAAGGQLHSTGASKAIAQWTRASATRADSLRHQTIGDVQISTDSFVEFDGMTWTNLTVTSKQTGAALQGLTLEIPLKAEWAELLKPYDDYVMQQTGALSKAGWHGKAASMPWVGNGDGGIQFLVETTAGWVGNKNIELVPDGKGTVVMRAHFVEGAVTLDKPLQLSFGWMVSPVKATPKSQRDWRMVPSWRPWRARDVFQKATSIGGYFRKSIELNPGMSFIMPWYQGWWWLPEADFKGNYDNTGFVPVPAGNANMNAVVRYGDIKFDAAAYGRLSESGTANAWFEQFGDEWVANTDKFVPNASSSPALQGATVSQASASLSDFYAWNYNRLLNEGDVHALYFDISTPISDSNIYHGAGTVLPDGTIEPIRNILGIRRTLQRIYNLMKAKHPDGKIFYHLSGELMLPIESFADGLLDGENYAFLLHRPENRGYEKILSVDQFRAQFSPQTNRGSASFLIPQFERMGVVTPDEWPTEGYSRADYMLGLVFLHDSNIWWESLPDEYWTKAFGAFEATGRNADWSFTPYWHQKEISLPAGVYASTYQSPDQKKAVLVIMNTSGKDQDINVPLALNKNLFRTAQPVYPRLPVNVQNGTISALHLANNSFRAVLIEK
jgi:hypothetical protein